MDQKSRSVKDCWKRSMVFMGLDWAKDHHQILVLDREGRVVLDRQIEHTAEGWHQLRDKLVKLAGMDLSLVAVAIETNCGPAVERR